MWVIKFADGATVSILKRPQKCSKNMIAIPEAQKYLTPKARPNHKVNIRKTVILQPLSQNWVTVSRMQAGFLHIDPFQKLKVTRQCSTSKGTCQVESRKDFNIMIFAFWRQTEYLTERSMSRNCRSPSIGYCRITHYSYRNFWYWRKRMPLVQEMFH